MDIDEPGITRGLQDLVHHVGVHVFVGQEQDAAGLATLLAARFGDALVKTLATARPPAQATIGRAV